MSADNLSLSEKYRPQKFDQFVGQVEARAYLSQQVNERRGRSVLLHGPTGCGKSSLADVYAAGLLCTASTERPCRSANCGSCSSFRYGTNLNLKSFHFGRVADEEFADQINADVRAETFGNGHFVVLINRAGLLSARAFSILHDQMKRPYERVTFILCADDLNAVPREVASLFFPISIKPPSFVEAVEYLTRLCKRTGASIDAKALEILADLGRTSFERLALDLEVLIDRGDRTASRILEHYLRGEAASYVDLVLRRSEFAVQLSALEKWDRKPDDKIRDVGEYLSRVFDVRHGLSTGSLRWLEQFSEISDQIMKHAEIVKEQPRSFANRMLQIWDSEPNAGGTTIRRKASEFDDLLAGAIINLESTNKVIRDWRASERRTRLYREVEAREKSRSTISGVESGTDDTSLTLREARKLWDGASFMVQAHGCLLNTKLEIRHGEFDPKPATKPERVVTDFLREFRIYVNRGKVDPSSELHTLYAHQTDARGDLVTRIVAHLPRCKGSIADWMHDFFRRRTGASSVEHAVWLDRVDEEDGLQRHLELIRSICGGVMPTEPEHQVFLRRTRIDVKRMGWSPGQKTTSQRVGLSRLIDREAQAKASEDLQALFALDSDDADPCTGWELKEFEYRRSIVEERLRLEAAARDRADNGLSLRSVQEQLRKRRELWTAVRPGFHSLEKTALLRLNPGAAKKIAARSMGWVA